MHHVDEDSQELTVISERHKTILCLKAKRQKVGHSAYGVVALILAGAAVGLWGFILRDASLGPPAPPSHDYLAFLAFAIVLGFCAAGSAFTWMVTRILQRQAGDLDVLMEYEFEQMEKRADRRASRIINATIRGLADEDRRRYIRSVAEEFKAETAGILNSDGKSTVTPFTRARSNQRSS
ncbi:hypothetical protein ACFYUR_19280 [Micromonospora haikouensis]|uniref:hypothetical protein n=1 Tax=Micromonospora haikouensis TaxID=686309 RepID=UPI00368037FB